MKILLFIDGLGSGGAERQLVGLAKILKDNKYQIRVVSYKKNATFYVPFLEEHKIIFCTYNTNKLLGWWVLLKEIYKFKPNLIISYLGQANLYACLIRLFNNTPLIISDRNTNISISLKDKIRFKLYNVADAIVPNSYSQTEFLKLHCKKLINKLYTIINFTDTDYFKPNNSRLEKNIRIIVVARVVPQKNVLGFIDAIYTLVKDGFDNFNISWYGDKSDEKYVLKCENKIKDYKLDHYISLCGENKHILQTYQESYALCLPSFKEGTPNVICEAMSCGLPILCSAICDNPKYIQEGENGFLFNPNNSDCIANAIKQLLLTESNEIDKIRIKNREKAVKLFSKQKFGDNYIRIINKLTNR